MPSWLLLVTVLNIAEADFVFRSLFTELILSNAISQILDCPLVHFGCLYLCPVCQSHPEILGALQ